MYGGNLNYTEVDRRGSLTIYRVSLSSGKEELYQGYRGVYEEKGGSKIEVVLNGPGINKAIRKLHQGVYFENIDLIRDNRAHSRYEKIRRSWKKSKRRKKTSQTSDFKSWW